MTSSSRGFATQAPGAGTMPQSFSGADRVLHKLLLAGCSALLIGRLLVPTEGAWRGDTLIFVQLWLGLALLWVWERYAAGNLTFSIDRYDVVVMMLVGGHVLSACGVLMNGGDKRAALNLLWEWISLGISFRLMRDAFRTGVERRNLVIAMLSTAVALAGLGIWQHHAWYAQTTAEYDKYRSELDQLERQPAPNQPREAAIRKKQIDALRKKLAEQGIDPHMQSGIGRAQLENRLKNSTEPFGEFALANTFAGFLLLWLLILAPLPFAALESRDPGRLWRLAILVGAAILLGYCLLLTKSRTAYVGVVTGMVVWRLSLLFRFRPSIRAILVWGGGGAVLASALFAIAFFTGGIDRLVLAEAPKSLAYRLEYWRGSWEVVKEHPLLGSGPGNFRQHYLRHKLPQSSEEIADPHNLFLDAWANGGLLGLAGLIGFVVLSCGLLRENPFLNEEMDDAPGLREQRHPPKVDGSQPERIPIASSVGNAAGEGSVAAPPRAVPAPRVPNPRIDRSRPGLFERRFNPHPVLWGGVIVFPTLYFGEFMIDHHLVALGIVTTVMMALFYGFDCVRLEALPSQIWGAALVGLLVHLLGAGGIGMPAITQCLFLALALGIPARPRVPEIDSRRSWRVVAAGACGLALFVACLVTATGPVLRRGTFIALGDDAVRRNLPFWESSYRRAAEADPLAAEPWERLAEETFRSWDGGSDSDSLFERSIEFEKEAIQRDPLNCAGYRRVGNAYLMKWRKHRSIDDANRAADALAQAVAYYPNNSAMLAELADADQAAGRTSEAALHAGRALELDQSNRAAGHTDRYLPEQTCKRLEAIKNSPQAVDPGADAPGP